MAISNNLGWYLITGMAIICFVVTMFCSLYGWYSSWLLQMLLEEKGVPLLEIKSERFGFRSPNYERDRFLSWCRQVLPDEPILRRVLVMDKVQGWSAVMWFIFTVMSARGCFHSK